MMLAVLLPLEKPVLNIYCTATALIVANDASLCFNQSYQLMVAVA